ncbi:MAG: transporter [Firmicutes bacterium HGW-Firmicutes-1]|nr:MAG: transporter [Firmicutes bacterium HGW-Firmicutes-1]
MSENESVSSIQRSSSSRSRASTRKPKVNQIPFGVLLLVIIAGITMYLSIRSDNIALFFITGICFGFILQKSRFCFTASLRDPYLTGSTSVTRAVLIAFAFTTIGFTAIKYGFFAKGLPIPGAGFVAPISFATLLGAFLFGIGAVIAGGCASGTLMRVGEGFTMQMLSLVFFVIGSLWAAHDFEWWKYNIISKGKPIFLPDIFGWIGALIIQLLIILLLYIAAEKYQTARTLKDQQKNDSNN